MSKKIDRQKSIHETLYDTYHNVGYSNKPILTVPEYYAQLYECNQLINQLSTELKSVRNNSSSSDNSQFYLKSITDIFTKHDSLTAFRIMKTWISDDIYPFKNIYPVSFNELVDAVICGIEKYNKEFPKFRFLFDNSLNWNPTLAYEYIRGFRQDMMYSTTEKLARYSTKIKDKNMWNIWRLSLRYVMTIARESIYNLYKSKNIPLDHFGEDENRTLTRWLYELARFPAGTVSLELFYKKLMLSYLLEERNPDEKVDSGMTEGLLYNLCFSLHLSGIETIYYGSYLNRKTKLHQSCHNSAAANEFYVNAAECIKKLLTKHNFNKKAIPLHIKNKGELHVYFAVVTNYQLIILGVNTENIIGDADKNNVLAKTLLRTCLNISGINYDDSLIINCENKENHMTGDISRNRKNKEKSDHNYFIINNDHGMALM